MSVKNYNDGNYNVCFIPFYSPLSNLKTCFETRLSNSEFCVLDFQEIYNRFLSLVIEDQAFVECPDTDVVKALVDLMSSYYVIDISYPDCMVGILLQDIALESIDYTYNSLGLHGFEKVFRTLHTKCFTLNNTDRFIIIFL